MSNLHELVGKWILLANEKWVSRVFNPSTLEHLGNKHGTQRRKTCRLVDSLVNLNPQFHSKRFILEQYSKTSPDHFLTVIVPSPMAGRSGVIARPVCQALYKYSYATRICILRYHPIQISGEGAPAWALASQEVQKSPRILGDWEESPT